MFPEALLKQPCKCVYCADCRGQGEIRVRMSDIYNDDDFLRCDTCSGHGITEQCDRCHMMDEIEEAHAL
jgi:DnaJ-class molecular chaperone